VEQSSPKPLESVLELLLFARATAERKNTTQTSAAASWADLFDFRCRGKKEHHANFRELFGFNDLSGSSTMARSGGQSHRAAQDARPHKRAWGLSPHTILFPLVGATTPMVIACSGRIGPCLLFKKFYKIFQILCHIESLVFTYAWSIKYK